MDVERLTDWLWRLHRPEDSSYAVRDGDGWNLIDTGLPGGGEAIIGCLSRLSGGPAVVKEIVITHGHRDHVGSAAELRALTGAPILGPAGEADLIEGGLPLPPPQLADWEVPLYEALGPEALSAAPATALDQVLRGGDDLDWERAATVIAAPGHTAGSIALLFPGPPTVLVAGDAIASHEEEPMLGVFNAEPDRAVETLLRLARLDFDIACFGHGAPLVGDAGTRIRRLADQL